MNTQTCELKNPVKEARTESGKADHTRGIVFEPRVDIVEVADNLLLHVDLPGVTLENLELTITDGNRLTLQGQRKSAALDKTTWHRQERSFGSFSRTLTLPVLVDSERVEARFELGDLCVKLPKSPKAKPRLIEVKQARSGKQTPKKGKTS